jgi:hypothetical protein
MAFPTQTQFIPRDKLDNLAIIMAWIFGVIVPFAVSTLGNYIAFSGGTWDDFSLWHLDGSGILLALLWQGVSTVAQFAFKARARQTGAAGWWIAYIISLLVSVVPSVIAYYALVSARLIALVARYMALAGATALVGFIVAVVCVIGDMLPEWVAVEG